MEKQTSTGSAWDVVLDAVLAVLRHWHIVAGIYAGVVATAVVAGIFLRPPEYQARAKILLTVNRADISTSAERPTELVRTSQLSLGELNSQLEILRSRDLIAEVLAGWDEPAAAPSDGRGVRAILASVLDTPGAFIRAVYRRLHYLDHLEPSSQAYRRITETLNNLFVGALKNSNVIEVTFTGANPLWARDFVNRLTAAYLEWHARLRGVSEAENFFIKQADLLQQKLVASEQGLRQLREKAGTLAGQQAEVHQRLNEFSAELTRAQIARVEQGQRLAFLERRQPAAVRKVRVATPQLLELEAKRAELVGHYDPDSERARDLDGQIDRLRGAIASYDTVATGTDTPGNDLMQTRATVAALKGKEEALQRVRDEYHKQAELLDSQDYDLVRLERQVKVNEEAYLSYVRTAEEARLSNALEQSKLLRLAVIENATLPLDPVASHTGRLLGFALLGGLAVSVGATFAFDQFDTTLKRTTDVRRYCNLEVLAVLTDRV